MQLKEFKVLFITMLYNGRKNESLVVTRIRKYKELKRKPPFNLLPNFYWASQVVKRMKLQPSTIIN